MNKLSAALVGVALMLALTTSASSAAKTCCDGSSCCNKQACCNKAKEVGDSNPGGWRNPSSRTFAGFLTQCSLVGFQQAIRRAGAGWWVTLKVPNT